MVYFGSLDLRDHTRLPLKRIREGAVLHKRHVNNGENATDHTRAAAWHGGVHEIGRRIVTQLLLTAVPALMHVSQQIDTVNGNRAMGRRDSFRSVARLECPGAR
jgi:hypothetical protein